jgi:uncharacterized protein (TIGR03435 family)
MCKMLSLFGPLSVTLLFLQAPSAQNQPLAFEVASIKPHRLGGLDVGGMRPLPGGQTYVAGGIPVRVMIKGMYGITDSQIVGGPNWIDTELWDVVAKAARPSTRDQLHEMFQTLLADRFKMQFHHETREMRAYVLTVDKDGAKLTLNDAQDPFDFPLKSDGAGKQIGTRVSMPYLCWVLSTYLNTPVVDMTGLTRFYDFTLQWTPPRPRQAGELQPEPLFTEARSVFTALREDLGLRLESSKTGVQVFVIDHVERPSEN